MAVPNTRHGKKKKIWLSPTGLESLNRCPRCFWLKYRRGIAQPEGIVSRLANRFDGVIKKYFDLYRGGKTFPPLVEGKISGALENPFQEKYWYHYNDDYGFYGKLDECVIEDDGRFTPVDHKTSSSDPREKDVLPAYQTQLDSYAWLLEKNGKKTSGRGHLIFFYPDHSDDLHNGFQMVVHVETLVTDPMRAEGKFQNAVRVLEKPLPEASPACPFCGWHGLMEEELSSLSEKKKPDQEKLF